LLSKSYRPKIVNNANNFYFYCNFATSYSSYQQASVINAIILKVVRLPGEIYVITMTVEEYNICVDDFSDGVYRFILKNIRDEYKAKDIVQDTFEKLWLNVGGVKYSSAKSYIFSTAYHTLIDMVRREKRKVDFETVDTMIYSHNEQYSDLQEILHQAIQQLPESQRAVVLLRDYEGYSYEEIAQITGLSEAQVKVYIYRARVFLKNYIGKLEVVV